MPFFDLYWLDEDKKVIGLYTFEHTRKIKALMSVANRMRQSPELIPEDYSGFVLVKSSIETSLDYTEPIKQQIAIYEERLWENLELTSEERLKNSLKNMPSMPEGFGE